MRSFYFRTDCNVTGPLCERIELEGEELKCVDTVKDILLPVRASSLRGAERQLDLSDGKNFTTMEWLMVFVKVPL